MLNPEGFNQHATEHGARSRYARTNALVGLLLLAGLLREFVWLAENRPDVFRELG